MSDEIAEAAAYYVQVCREHERWFPVRNIVVVTDGYRAADDKDRFVSDVSAAVHLLRAALEILDRVPDVDPDPGDEINPAGEN